MPPADTKKLRQITLGQRAFYGALHYLCRLVAVVCFQFRCRGREKLPHSGPVLVCSNHQSFLDPVLVGLTLDRRLNYLARDSLFRSRAFGWLIRFLDAIPIDRSGSGTAGLRESLRRIRAGELVLIFPEGTRTSDGSVGKLKSGFCMLARRGDVALLPVGIAGAFEAWPRSAPVPRLASIRVCVGTPISPAEVQQLDDAGLVSELERRIRVCHRQATRLA